MGIATFKSSAERAINAKIRFKALALKDLQFLGLVKSNVCCFQSNCKELKKFCPPRSSDDLCLLFCIHPFSMGPTEDNLGYLSIYVLVVIIYSGLRTEDLGTRVPEYHSAKHLTNCGTAISSIKKKKRRNGAMRRQGKLGGQWQGQNHAPYLHTRFDSYSWGQGIEVRRRGVKIISHHRISIQQEGKRGGRGSSSFKLNLTDPCRT